MTRKAYANILIVFTAVFLLNTFFLQVKLQESYQQMGMSQFQLLLHEASELVQEIVGKEEVIDPVQYRNILNEIRSSFLADRLIINDLEGLSADANLAYRLQLLITDRKGLTLASSAGLDANATLPDGTLDIDPKKMDGEQIEVLQAEKSGDWYYMRQHLYKSTGDKEGYLVLAMSTDLTEDWVQINLRRHEELTIYIGLSGGLLLLVFCLLTPGRSNQQGKPLRKFHISVFMTVCVFLCASLLVNTLIFQENYLLLARANAKDIATKLITDRLHISDPANSVEGQLSTTAILDGYKEIYSQIGSLRIQSSATAAEPKASARKLETAHLMDQALIAYVEPKDLRVAVPLAGEGLSSGSEKIIVAELSIDNLLKVTWSLVSNGTTMLLVSLLLLVELLYLLFSALLKSDSKKNSNRDLVRFMRPAIFFFLLGIDISMAFVPLHMQNLYFPMLGLSKDLVMGLPISVEFFFVGIFILVAGIWVDRRGWHEPFIVGLLLAALGGLYSWLAPDALQFILSRAIIGTGYGLALMAAQGFVVKYSGSEGKATGLANLIAGLYAGSICGAVLGSIMAEVYGYRPVFMVGGLISFAVILYTLLSMHRAMRRPRVEPVKQQSSKWAAKKVIRFLFDLDVIALSLFSSMPASIAIVGFLNYFTPVFLDDISIPESTIGQVLMIYGFSLIFLGPVIGRYIDKSKNKKTFVIFGGFLGAAAFLTFDAAAGVSSAVISVILLSISSSFVLSSQSTMVLNLRVTRELGEGKALGIFRSISRAGQVIGPILFGGIFLASDINTVMTYFGVAYLIAVALLLFLVRENRESELVVGECHES